MAEPHARMGQPMLTIESLDAERQVDDEDVPEKLSCRALAAIDDIS